MSGGLLVRVVVYSSTGREWSAEAEDVNPHRVDYARAIARLAENVEQDIFGEYREPQERAC